MSVDWRSVRSKWAAFFMAWWDKRDTTKDVRYLAFAVYVAATVVWLTREQSMRGLTSQWVDAFKWFALSTSLGGAAWMWAEARGGTSGETSRPIADEGAKYREGGEA